VGRAPRPVLAGLRSISVHPRSGRVAALTARWLGDAPALLFAELGGIFNFPSGSFAGSLGANPPSHPIVSVVAL